MKIEHVDGRVVDTTNMTDIDALLLEESKKLQELYAKYNRQLFLAGEVKATPESPARSGVVFFHVGNPDDKELGKAWNTYFWRLNAFIMQMSNGNLFIGHTNPPQE